MKVLVTGAGGQLGLAMQHTAPDHVELVVRNRQELDITRPDTVRTVCGVKPEVIINAAAYTAVDRAESESEAAYAVNATGAENLAKATRELGCRLTHISTDFVFDGSHGRPYRPDDEPNPLSVYGASKLAGESVVREICPDALIVRTAWVYAEEGQNFLLTMLRLMRERESVQVIDDQIGTPTYATSLAEAIWHGVRKGAKGTQHWTNSGVASWYDFAVAIHERALRLGLLAKPVHIEPVGTQAFPRPARRPSISVLDKRSGYEALGAGVQWQKALDECLNQVKTPGK